MPNGAFVNLDAGIVTGPDGTPRLIPPGLTPDQVNAWANSLTADSSQPVSRPDLAIYQAEDLSSRQSLWPGVTGPSFDQPSVDLFAPSGASLVADAVGPSDDIQATIMQQQDSLYRSGPADDIWGATFGEFGLQLPVRPRPGRTYHRRLTAIQTINEGPVLLDEFSQAAWLSPVLTAATGIGSAAITAALAPRPVIQAQAPVFIAQPPAAPPSSLQAQSQGVGHSALQILDQDKWVIIGGIGALALLFIMMRKK